MKVTIITVVSVVLLSISNLAVASESFYIGASAGTSYGRDVCDDLTTIGDCGDSDTGFKVYGGYQFTPVWGVEAFYTDLGEFTATDYSLGILNSINVSASADGIGTVATASWPIGDNFAIFSKLGFLYWSVDSSASMGAQSASISDDGLALAAGLGLRYSLTENFGVRADWDWYSVGDESTTGDSDVDLFSAGIFVSF